MNSQAVAQKLIEVHLEILKDSGSDPLVITPSACPLSDVPGFDSLLVPTAVRMTLRALGIKLPKDTKIDNMYVSPDGKRKLTISEIAQRVCQTFSTMEVAK